MIRQAMRVTIAAVFATLAPVAHASDYHDHLAPRSGYYSIFPQIADGGGASQRWISTLTLANPRTFSVTYAVYFFDNAGNYLPIDFGYGPTSQFTVTVPPVGTVTYRSTGAPAQLHIGWVLIISQNEIVSTLLYEFTANGVPQQGVSVPESAASNVWYSIATASTGIAWVNQNTFSIQINVILIDQNGSPLFRSASGTYGEGAHASFNVAQVWPEVPSDFRGSILAWTPSGDNFVATAISGDGGVLSAYPVIAAPNPNNITIP